MKSSEQAHAASWLDRISTREPAPQPVAGDSAVDRQMPLIIAAIALIAMVLLGPLMTISNEGFTGEGSVTRQIGYFVIVAFTLFAIRNQITWRSVLVLPWPMLLALGWCWISLFWAIDPGVGLRRVLLTTLVAWTVFTLVAHGGYRLNTDVLRYTLLASVVISLVVVYLDPVTGVHQLRDWESMPSVLTGNWRGIYAHKNFAGAVCAITLLLFVFDAGHVRRGVRVFAILLCAYFLWRSQSKTSGGMVFLSMLGGWVFTKFSTRLRAYLLSALMLGVSLGWFLVAMFADQVIAQVVSPAAFTGRGHIWSALLRYAADHPITGAGFGSFWNIEAGSPVFQYGLGYVTKITVGHSGYIDQLVTVGLPGVLLMVFALVVWPLARILASSRVAAGPGALVSSMLMFCVGHNVTESGLFERDMIVSTIFFFAAAIAYDLTVGEQWKRKRAVEGDSLMREMRQRGRARRKGVASQTG